jgi:hypothetical protein
MAVSILRQPVRDAVQYALLNTFIGRRGLTLTLHCSSQDLITYSDNFLKLNYTIKYCKPIKIFCIDTNMSDNDTELHIDSHPEISTGIHIPSKIETRDESCLFKGNILELICSTWNLKRIASDCLPDIFFLSEHVQSAQL